MDGVVPSNNHTVDDVANSDANKENEVANVIIIMEKQGEERLP